MTGNALAAAFILTMFVGGTFAALLLRVITFTEALVILGPILTGGAALARPLDLGSPPPTPPPAPVGPAVPPPAPPAVFPSAPAASVPPGA